MAPKTAQAKRAACAEFEFGVDENLEPFFRFDEVSEKTVLIEAAILGGSCDTAETAECLEAAERIACFVRTHPNKA